MSRNQDTQTQEITKNGKSNRGFASMDPQLQRVIASQGGKAAHEKGTAHEFNSDEARVAGRKGGETVSRDRDHMSQIGRKGGQASGGNRNRSQSNGIEHSGHNAPR
jgi:uncharacterized protein